jgi:hypothetical protein
MFGQLTAGFPQREQWRTTYLGIRLLETCTVYRKAWVSGTRNSFSHYAIEALYTFSHVVE